MAGSSEGKTAVQQDREYLKQAKSKGKLATLGAFFRLSGPGWLQSAITLGGGSLASGLYLGILGGMAVLWVQPVAMILGVIMLSAISYVTLSSGKKPLKAINQHVNPVLGWGWVAATVLANVVWSLPQFSLATAAVRQNLLPGLLGSEAMPDFWGDLIVCVPILLVCVGMAWAYGGGVKGARIFDWIIKGMVGLIVVSFIGVVIRLSFAEKGIDFGRVLGGFVPDFSLLWSPGETYGPYLQEVAAGFRDFWQGRIVNNRLDTIIAAVATAVGINMTFLRPYSMLKRGWDKTFRGLAIFDLSIGLFLPFLLATACIVIASASQFHTKPVEDLLPEGGFRPGKPEAAGKYDTLVREQVEKQVGGEQFPQLSEEEIQDRIEKLSASDKRMARMTALGKPGLASGYNEVATARVKAEMEDEEFENLDEEQIEKRIENLPEADKRMAAMLVRRDSFDLADSLSPLTGSIFAQYVFGIGVVGVAVSSIIILMLINGFAVCEIFDRPWGGWTYRLGCLAPAIGFLGPFVWKGAQAYLAVPTSVFCMCLLPVAYFSFYFMMNQKKILGDDMPRGIKRVIWNVLMAFSAGMAALASIWVLWSKARWKGVAVLVAFVGLAVVVHFVRKGSPEAEGAEQGAE